MIAAAVLVSMLPFSGQPILPVADKVVAKKPDCFVPADRVELGGYLGRRIEANVARLKSVDLEPLLNGFRHRPGSHPWIGEHIGKWMHASVLAWAETGDPVLKSRLDYAVAELLKTQEPDGYLGTYAPDQRFGLFEGADWDVWSHKYCLIGLLAYYRYTGSQAALRACVRVGDLLSSTFGPGRRSILSAGTHMGMAATSVLEPIVLLYRATGEPRYLTFAREIVSSWDETGGPRILSGLLAGSHVGHIANGKAYEMLSNLVGLCELARTTGEDRLLKAALRAWEDVRRNQLYITGTASYFEHFHEDHDLPDAEGSNVGETCVTVTWMQLTEQLLRMTGSPQYADELERSAYNHLAGAQRPDGAAWCYYTPLKGGKPYTDETCCCLSSGPRGMALVPRSSFYVTNQREGPEVVVNTFETAQAQVTVGGSTVRILQRSGFPESGSATLRIKTDSPTPFGLLIHAPPWARNLHAVSEGVGVLKGGWLHVRARDWTKSRSVKLAYEIGSSLIRGGPSQPDSEALTWGPFVLAYDGKRNVNLGPPVQFAVEGDRLQRLHGLEFRARLMGGTKRPLATFRPFADVGSDGSSFRVWMRRPDVSNPYADALFLGAQEGRSSEGNVTGSVCDGDPGTFVVTFDDKPQQEAWFEVRQSKPRRVGRIVFCHGRTFHDGGWFDTSEGKPRVQVKEHPGSSWEDVGVLTSYPDASAANPARLENGSAFTLVLKSPVKALAIRVIGKPACGDRPTQSFASCAELQAYGR